ncbi:MAG: sigma-70 family RNA polymerase sigma factor [Gemmataceae bacterium]
MDARKSLGAAVTRPPIKPIHSDTPELGPPLSVEQIYRDYAPTVYNVARRMVATDVDAEDVTQDVLLQVVRKLPSFRGESAFPTWLHRVTVNAALTHRRRQAVREEHGLTHSIDVTGEDQAIPAALARGGDTPDDQVVNSEVRQLIDHAVNRLPEAYRLVFVLADVEGLPNQEIADQLDMSLPAVKSRLHRARAMLRESLAPHFEDTAV